MKPRDLPTSFTVAACITAAALMAITADAARPEFPIQLAELQAEAEARLAEIDADDDGLVSSAEFEAADGFAPADDRRRGWRGSRDRRGGRDWRGGRGDDRGAVFNEADANDDEQLSQEEFEAIPQAVRTLAKRRMFDRLDKNDDGSLTAAELPSRHARLATLDANDDGQITRDEMPRRGRRGHR